MPVERRIRTGLARNADAVDPELTQLLGVVQRRARRRVITRRVAAGLAVAAAVAAVIVGGPQAWHTLGGLHRPAPVQQTHKPHGRALSGPFSRTVGPGGGAVRSNHLAGRWTMRLGGGTIEAVSAPSAFTGVLSAYEYQVRGSEFRTNLFIDDICANMPVGTYRWARSARTLRLTVVSDSCRARAALLTSGPWQEKS